MSLSALAQLEVKDGSFKEVPGFVNINTEKMYDDNDKPYAVLKIKTENIDSKVRHELYFKGDAQTFFEVEYQDGEVWLYISYYATYIKISHEELSSTEFHFPFDMKPKCGYELTLVNISANTNSGIGTLTIISKPEIDATITINGKIISYKTPYTNDMIPSGRYEITLSKERYKTVTKSVSIKDGDDTTVEIDMPIDVAKITLTADNNTEIYIDSVFKTQGTWTGELYSGTHQIVYRKQYHHDASQTIQVEAGKSKKYELKPTPINGTISIDTEPSGATVYVDNKNVGTTPLEATYIIGKHNVKVDKNGFGSVSWDVVIKENDTLYYKKVLGEVTYITIQSNPYDQIYIDGQYEGYSPVKKNLSEGKHVVKVQRGYNKPYEQEIVVKPDGEKVFNIIVDPNDVTTTKKESSNRSTDNSYIDDAYYHPDKDNNQYNNAKITDLSFHIDVGCYVGLGTEFIKNTIYDYDNRFTDAGGVYFAKGLYTTIKVNNIGLKIELTNLHLKADLYHTSSISYTKYDFSLISVPIMFGFESDKTYSFIYGFYLGPKINICNNATYTEDDGSSNQLKNYEKTSYNLVGEVNLGFRYDKLSISFLSLKCDITRPIIVTNTGTEKFSGDLKAFTFVFGMQLDYNF